MDDRDILQQIHRLVDEEHDLWSRSGRGQPLLKADRERLTLLEERLDQCWDLLRQRRARREAGQDPETAHERPGPQVERYLQ